MRLSIFAAAVLSVAVSAQATDLRSQLSTAGNTLKQQQASLATAQQNLAKASASLNGADLSPELKQKLNELKDAELALAKAKVQNATDVSKLSATTFTSDDLSGLAGAKVDEDKLSADSLFISTNSTIGIARQTLEAMNKFSSDAIKTILGSENDSQLITQEQKGEIQARYHTEAGKLNTAIQTALTTLAEKKQAVDAAIEQAVTAVNNYNTGTTGTGDANFAALLDSTATSGLANATKTSILDDSLETKLTALKTPFSTALALTTSDAGASQPKTYAQLLTELTNTYKLKGDVAKTSILKKDNLANAWSKDISEDTSTATLKSQSALTAAYENTAQGINDALKALLKTQDEAKSVAATTALNATNTADFKTELLSENTEADKIAKALNGEIEKMQAKGLKAGQTIDAQKVLIANSLTDATDTESKGTVAKLFKNIQDTPDASDVFGSGGSKTTLTAGTTTKTQFTGAITNLNPEQADTPLYAFINDSSKWSSDTLKSFKSEMNKAIETKISSIKTEIGAGSTDSTDTLLKLVNSAVTAKSAFDTAVTKIGEELGKIKGLSAINIDTSTGDLNWDTQVKTTITSKAEAIQSGVDGLDTWLSTAKNQTQDAIKAHIASLGLDTEAEGGIKTALESATFFPEADTKTLKSDQKEAFINAIKEVATKENDGIVAKLKDAVGDSGAVTTNSKTAFETYAQALQSANAKLTTINESVDTKVAKLTANGVETEKTKIETAKNKLLTGQDSGGSEAIDNLVSAEGEAQSTIRSTLESRGIKADTILTENSALFDNDKLIDTVALAQKAYQDTVDAIKAIVNPVITGLAEHNTALGKATTATNGAKEKLKTAIKNAKEKGLKTELTEDSVNDFITAYDDNIQKLKLIKTTLGVNIESTTTKEAIKNALKDFISDDTSNGKKLSEILNSALWSADEDTATIVDTDKLIEQAFNAVKTELAGKVDGAIAKLEEQKAIIEGKAGDTQTAIAAAKEKIDAANQLAATPLMPDELSASNIDATDTAAKNEQNGWASKKIADDKTSAQSLVIPEGSSKESITQSLSKFSQEAIADILGDESNFDENGLVKADAIAGIQQRYASNAKKLNDAIDEATKALQKQKDAIAELEQAVEALKGDTDVAEAEQAIQSAVTAQTQASQAQAEISTQEAKLKKIAHEIVDTELASELEKAPATAKGVADGLAELVAQSEVARKILSANGATSDEEAKAQSVADIKKLNDSITSTSDTLARATNPEIINFTTKLITKTRLASLNTTSPDIALARAIKRLEGERLAGDELSSVIRGYTTAFDAQNSLWGNITGSHASVKDAPNVNMYAVSLGYDRSFDTAVLGVLGTYATSKAKDDSLSLKNTSFALGAYARYYLGQSELEAKLNAGVGRNKLNRSVSTAGAGTLSYDAKFNSSFFNLSLEYGYVFDLGEGLYIKPLAGLEYDYNKNDSFKENGSELALSFSGVSTKVLSAKLGAEVRAYVADKSYLYVTPALVREISKKADDTIASFVGVDNAIRYKADNKKRTYFELQAGGEMALNEALSANINLGTKLNNKQSFVSATVGLKYKF